MMKAKSRLTGYLMILISAIGFGTYGVWSKLLGADFGIYSQGWVRSAIVLAILLPLAYLTKAMKPVAKGDRKWMLVPVIFGIGTQAPLYYAYNHGDIGTATLVFYAVFLITSYVIGRLYIGERITTIKIISLVLAALGLFLVFGMSLAAFSVLALSLAAINGIASGGEVATSKLSTTKYSSLQVGIYVWIGILITHLPASILAGESFVPFAANGLWLAMLAYSLIGLAAFWLVVEGFKYVDAGVGGLIGLLEIIFAIVFGVLFFNEQITLTILIGGVFIILAGMLPDLSSTVHSKRKQRLINQEHVPDSNPLR